MSEQTRDVTSEYQAASAAVAKYDPGAQPNIADHMRSAFVHGYAQALLDRVPPEALSEDFVNAAGLQAAALRAEVAALKAQNQRVRLVNKEGAAQVDQLQTELTQLRALRDRVAALAPPMDFENLMDIIATAEKLKDTA